MLTNSQGIKAMLSSDRLNNKHRNLYMFISEVVILTSMWKVVIARDLLSKYSFFSLIYYVLVVAALWSVYSFFMSQIILNYSRHTWFRRISGVLIFGSLSYVLSVSMAYYFKDIVSEGALLYTEWAYVLPLFYFYQAVKIYLVNQVTTFEMASKLDKRSELRNLQTRIYPHFLFNALNNIAAMMHSNPDKAEDSLLNLADVMRASISTPDKLVPLIDEVNLSLKYAEVESLRWENMRFKANIPDSCKDFMIPSLIIQPLIENAVYHGVSKRSDGGLVTINAVRDEEDWIHVKVSNPLPNTDKETSSHRGNGFALESVEKRLKLLYEKASFDTKIVDGLYVATISFNADSYNDILSIEAGQFSPNT